jgi:hypothetical protein
MNKDEMGKGHSPDSSKRQDENDYVVYYVSCFQERRGRPRIVRQSDVKRGTHIIQVRKPRDEFELILQSQSLELDDKCKSDMKNDPIHGKNYTAYLNEREQLIKDGYFCYLVGYSNGMRVDGCPWKYLADIHQDNFSIYDNYLQLSVGKEYIEL